MDSSPASTHPSVDIVVVASSGHVAIVPTIRALELGKTVALANKETLVCAGEIIAPLAAANGTPIRPIDSEHCAIWQALDGSPIEQVTSDHPDGVRRAIPYGASNQTGRGDRGRGSRPSDVVHGH